MINPSRVVIASLILFSVWGLGLLFVVPSSVSRGVGICLIAIGALNILAHRKSGRQLFSWALSMPSFVANFWRFIGKEEAQFLYLGIGVILGTTGLLLLAKSFY